MTAALVAVLVFAALAPTASAMPPRGRAPRSLGRLGSAAARARAQLRRRPRRSASHEAIPQALELMARALRAGASLRTAIDAVAAELPEAELSGVADRVQGGLSLTEALDRWAAGSADRQTAAALLVLGHSSGAAMASSLDRAAASIRQRGALSDEIRALTAQTRTSGIVVAVAPVGFGAIIALVDRDALRVLLTTAVGWVSLAVGLTLECLGVWWMSRLSKGVATWV